MGLGPNEKVRIGIIGCGGIANGKHMPSLAKLNNVEMVAFCDIVVERAEAAKAKVDAESAKAEYESHLREARVEAAAITSRAVENAKRQSAELVKAAEAETVALREKATRDIELERRKAMNEAKGEISSLAVELASKVVKKEIQQKDHEALFEQFIDELGEKL